MEEVVAVDTLVWLPTSEGSAHYLDIKYNVIRVFMLAI